MIAHKKTTILFFILAILNTQIVRSAAQPSDQVQLQEDLARLNMEILKAGSLHKSRSFRNQSYNQGKAHQQARNAIRNFRQKYPHINLEYLKVLPGQTLMYLLATSNLWITLRELLESNPDLQASEPNAQPDHDALNSTVLLTLCLSAQNYCKSPEEREEMFRVAKILLARNSQIVNVARHNGLTPIQACLSSATLAINMECFMLVYHHMKQYYPEKVTEEALWNYVKNTKRYTEGPEQTKATTVQRFLQLLTHCNNPYNIQAAYPADPHPAQPAAMYPTNNQASEHTNVAYENDVDFLRSALLEAARSNNCANKTFRRDPALNATANTKASNALSNFQEKYPHVNIDDLNTAQGQPIPFFLATLGLWPTLHQLLLRNPQLTASKPNEQQDYSTFMSTTLLTIALKAQNYHTSSTDRILMHEITNLILSRNPQAIKAQRYDGLNLVEACLSSVQTFTDLDFFRIIQHHALQHYPEILNEQRVLRYVERVAQEHPNPHRREGQLQEIALNYLRGWRQYDSTPARVLPFKVPNYSSPHAVPTTMPTPMHMYNTQYPQANPLPAQRASPYPLTFHATTTCYVLQNRPAHADPTTMITYQQQQPPYQPRM